LRERFAAFYAQQRDIRPALRMYEDIKAAGNLDRSQKKK
jgi:hypothetical protein